MGIWTSPMYGPSLREHPPHLQTYHKLPKNVAPCSLRIHHNIASNEGGHQIPADCINFSQGFMNCSPPSWLLDESHKSMDAKLCQITTHM